MATVKSWIIGVALGALIACGNGSGVVVTDHQTPSDVRLIPNATQLAVSATLKLTASAQDDTGVTTLELLEGSAVLKSVNAAQTTFELTFLSKDIGSHRYRSRATDAAGNFAESPEETVTVSASGNGDTQAPTAVTLSVNAAQLQAPATLQLTGAAQDNIAVTRLELRDGETVLQSVNAAQNVFSRALDLTDVGQHRYQLRAFDAAGNFADSPEQPVTVTAPNPANLIVNLSAAPSTVTTPGQLTLSASATPASGIASLEFFQNGKSFAKVSASSATQTVSFKAGETGGRSFEVIATDTAGHQQSKAVTVTLQADTQNPTANLSLSSTSIETSGSVTFTASATDNQGITSLSLLEGTTVVQTWSAPPYTLTRSYPTPGSFTYTARAVDTSGNQGSSPPVTLSVRAPSTGGTVNFVSSNGAQVGELAIPAANALVFSTPTGWQAGDLLVALVSLNAPASMAVTPPSGWQTLSGYPLEGGGDALKSVWVFTRIASSEANNASFGFPSLTNARGVILAYRGATSVLEAHAVLGTRGTNLVAPALNAPAGAKLLRLISIGPVNHDRRVTNPQNLTVRYDSDLTKNLSMLLVEETQAQTGSSGTRSFGVVDDQGRTEPLVVGSPYTAITLALVP